MITLPLPVAPSPQPDEWLGSWLARLAHANLLAPHRLLNVLGIEHGMQRLPDALLHQISQATGVSPATIQQLEDVPDPLPRHDRLRSDSYALFKVQKIQICPICLAQDSEPYIRRGWVRQSHTICDIHQITLIETCPHCHKYLHVATTARPDRRGVTFSSSIRSCWNCRGDLTQARAKALPPLLPFITSLGGISLQGLRRDEFYLALWRYIHTFYLYNMLEVNSLNIWHAPQKGSRVGADKFLARHRSEILARWLLSDDPLTVHSSHHRLRLVANALLGVFINTDETSRPQRLYAVWLATHLRDAPPTRLVSYWPLLSHYLCDRLLGLQPACPAPRHSICLTNRQWDVVSPFLSDQRPIGAGDPREVFNFLLNRAVHGKDFKQVGITATQITTYRRLLDYWGTSPKLGMALGSLFDHLTSSLPGGGILRYAYDIRKADWSTETARLFLSDGILELLRQHHPQLHWNILLKLLNHRNQRKQPDQGR